MERKIPMPTPSRSSTVRSGGGWWRRLLAGPVKVGVAYELDREIVALSGSRRTESMWVRTRLFSPDGEEPIATMLLNTASLKASYAPYEQEFTELYGVHTDA